MREDIEVEVIHDAPLLLRGRRGCAPVQAAARQTTPARIRHVPPEALSDRPRVTAENVRMNGGLRLFEGRLWRGVSGREPWGTSRDIGSCATVEAVAKALAEPPELGVRNDLWQLSLNPLHVRNHYGRIAENPRVLDGATLDPAKLSLDLRAEASAAVARRVSKDLLHDGARVWVAVPTPLIRQTGIPLGVEPPPREKLNFAPWSLAGNFEDLIAYVRATNPPDSITKSAADRLRDTAGTLAHELAELAPTPLADIARGVRRMAILAPLCMASQGGMGDAASQAIRRDVEDLAPLVARATADLIDDRDLPEAMDRLAAAATRTLALRERRGMEASHNLHALRRVVAYAGCMVRPRFASGPVPDADIESLGMLVA